MPDLGEQAPLLLTVQSRGSIQFPLEKIFRHGIFEVYPQIEAKGLLFLQFKRGEVFVTAGKYIGLIPLSPAIVIDVRPKLPVSNLAHVLDRARVTIQSLVGMERLYQVAGPESASILEFLLENLVQALAPLRANGFSKVYHRQSETMSHPRGRIQLAQTIQSHWSKGQKHLVRGERFFQTANTAVNRTIRRALEYALTAVQNDIQKSELTARANIAHRELPMQIGSFQAIDYTASQRILEARSLPSSRAYYYRAIEISLLILSRRRVALDQVGSDIQLQSFIVDFEEVFEEYLRRTLTLAAPPGVSVRDGNGDGKKPLYDDRSNPPAQPDIVVQSDGRTVILEIKYKEKPDRADINQAIAYAVSYRTDRVVLVHQAKAGSPSGLGHIGTVNGIQVSSYAFDLDNAELQHQEEQFIASVFALLNETPITPVLQ